MTTPRSFDGREFCPGAPGPAVKPPSTLGICHTCGNFSLRKPTIQPAVFTHTTGPLTGTKDCTNWVPNGTQSHRPAALGGSDKVAVGAHVNTVQQRTEPRQSAERGGEVLTSKAGAQLCAAANSGAAA